MYSSSVKLLVRLLVDNANDCAVEDAKADFGFLPLLAFARMVFLLN